MLDIGGGIRIPDDEIDITAIRAGGPGGQNVNKVATAIHLRFDAGSSPSLPDDFRARLLELRDRRISAEGVIVIKVQDSRSQETNRRVALDRLRELLVRALAEPTVRKPTRPKRVAVEKRLQDKSYRSKLKESRRKPLD